MKKTNIQKSKKNNDRKIKAGFIRKIRFIFVPKRRIILFFVFIFWLGCYLLLNFITSFRETHNPSFAFESSIPLIPQFIFIYLMVYLVIFAPLFFVRKMDYYFDMAKSYVFVITVSCVIYLIYPAEFPRAELIVNSLSTWLLSVQRTVDLPYNLLPSMHVSMAFLSAFIVNLYSKRWGLFLILLSILISISTLFVKQHYLLDIITGLILAIIGYFLFKFLQK